ncbi:WD repeat-containing protein 27 [Dissostichus eleginoides]|uniref:WD repeat-containing protein 27 n=1 Tax=Dissostichus eleginoides TaxID=100907 RepID=A0AAD9CPT3_DISEL|nr:WD repeat-containing protein 27 [Dissostichus eleginoides]
MVTEMLSLPCDRLLSHRQLACCHTYCGIPLEGKNMLIYSNMDKDNKPLLLTGHHGEISAMTFGKLSGPVLLCSASPDYIIVWDIELCHRRTQEGKVAAGTVIGTLLGEVVHLSFCFSDERVAACSGSTLYILSSKRHEVIFTFTNHLGPLTSAEFCPWNKNILVTTSEDRTFKVLDLKTEAVCYQSFVLSGSPLLSVFFLEENRHLITGSTDGQLWCFSVPDDHKCHLVSKMDLQKMEKRHLQHQGTVSDPADGVFSELYVHSMCGPVGVTSVCPKEHLGLCSPPVLESPLSAEFKRKEHEHPKKKVVDSEVKSSGYTSAPRGLLLRDYPADSAAPTIPHTNLSIANKSVHCLQYSGDGKQILCGLGDSSVLLYKSSLTGNPTVYTGHDKPVGSVSWSLNRQWWLSASEDQSLRIWTHGSPEPAIIMGNSMFSKPVRSAQFYYLDKFLLLASGPSLYLYLYNVDITRDNIKRYQQRSVVKLTKCITSTSATDITALSAINDFFSYIVLACGSDRSIQVFDMNRGCFAAAIPDAHSRSIHCITQNKRCLFFVTPAIVCHTLWKASSVLFQLGYCINDGSSAWVPEGLWVLFVVPRWTELWELQHGSMFSTQAPDSYNLFLTSAVTDGVKMWDLRSLRCVRRYENHLNRCHPCSAAISPCGRFIASGSEDNCAYVYDIRSSSYLHKLQKHSDTVLSVAFNPATPQLLTGTMDGKLRLFQSSSAARLSRDTSAVHSVPH